jgi:hypothetical protein
MIALQAGNHPITINYLPNALDSSLSLQWKVPRGKMKPIPNAQFFADGGSIK